jgi:hypothetical protein
MHNRLRAEWVVLRRNHSRFPEIAFLISSALEARDIVAELIGIHLSSAPLPGVIRLRIAEIPISLAVVLDAVESRRTSANHPHLAHRPTHPPSDRVAKLTGAPSER